MRQYRYLAKVHCIGSHLDRPASYGYRKSLCGQTAYCREDPDKPSTYVDQFGHVPFVGWCKPHLITCKSCQKAMRK